MKHHQRPLTSTLIAALREAADGGITDDRTLRAAAAPTDHIAAHVAAREVSE